MNVLMLLCLVMLLGCTATNLEPVERVVVQTKYKPLVLDDWITQPVDTPTLAGNTWKDLSQLAIEYGYALQQCNMQLEAAKQKSDGRTKQ